LLGIYFGPAKWAKAIAVPRLPIPISHTSLPNDLARRQHYLQRLWGNATKMRNLQLHGLQWAYLFIKGEWVVGKTGKQSSFWRLASAA